MLKEHEPSLSKRLNDILGTPSSPLAAKEVAALLLTRLMFEKKDGKEFFRLQFLCLPLLIAFTIR
jgi:hypothetical protein